MAGKKQGKRIVLKGQALKTFRRNQSILKQKGLAKKGANEQKPTKYAIAKQRKLSDVIEGRAAVIKAPRSVRNAYSEKGIFQQFAGKLIVPKDLASQRVKITKGEFITMVTPLKNGQEETIIFPVNITDMMQVVQELKDNSSKYNSMLQGDEAFGFRLFGHNRIDSYPDIQDLIFTIETKYQHLFKDDNAQTTFQNFVLIRFTGIMRDLPEAQKVYSRKVDATGRNTNRRSNDGYSQSGYAKRQRKYNERIKNDPVRYAAKLAKDRARKAAKRNQGDN